VVDSGDQQQGVAGQALPLPLVAVVVDAGGNRLAGVAATLKVVKGAGTFTNGQPTLSLTSDVVTSSPAPSQCAASDSQRCGGMLHVDYTKVTHNCDSVSLFGAQLTEAVASDHHCTTKSVPIVTGAGCPVVGGNLLVGCHDDYSFCALTSALPTSYDCTETYTQRLFIGGCLAETHVLTLRIVKAGDNCSGSVTRN
jgi:hypothetical protein